MRIYIRRLKTTTLAASTCVFVFPRKRPSSHVPFPHVPRHLCSGPGRRALPPRSAEPCLHGAPGHSPRCRDRSCEQETPDPPGRGAAAATTGARGVGGEFGLGLSLLPTAAWQNSTFPSGSRPLPAATQRANSAPRQRRTWGSGARAAISPQRRAGPLRKRRVWPGWVCAPQGTKCSSRVLGTTDQIPFPRPREGCSGCGEAAAGLRAARGSWGDSLSRALGPGWEGAPRPLYPPPTPLAENNRSGAPPPPIQAGARLPLP